MPDYLQQGHNLSASQNALIALFEKMEIRDIIATDQEVPIPANENQDYPERFALEDEQPFLPIPVNENQYYPERLALEEGEQSLPDENDGGPARESISPKIGQETSIWVFETLAHNNISPAELTFLWYHLLTEKQRRCIRMQLHDTALGEDSPGAWTMLNKTLLSDTIKAWANFKNLLPSKLRKPGDSAQQIAMRTLQYCMMLEQAKAHGSEIASSYGGFVGSDPFSRHPITGVGFDADTKFEWLLEAFAERVCCCKVRPRWLSFTSIVVLQGMVNYIRDLKEVTLTIMPFLEFDHRSFLQRLED
ncbi:hypothetical protein MMC29_006541 [Sticta canariensis]|nr:hypothetical protein [Sticta canariensis]